MESLGASNIALGNCVVSSRLCLLDDVVVQVVVGEASTHSNPAADPALVSTGGGGSVRAAALEELSRSWGHSSQLKEWRDEEKALRSRLHRKEKNLSSAQSEIYQLLGLFSLFQGVIFTAIAQSTIVTCAYWLSPFGLSLTVMAVTLFALQQKLKVFYDVQAEVVDIKLQTSALFYSIEDLKTKGCAFVLDDLCSQPRTFPQQPGKPQHCSARLRRLLFEYSYAIAVTATVLFLSSIILASCHTILCRGCSCSS